MGTVGGGPAGLKSGDRWEGNFRELAREVAQT